MLPGPSIYCWHKWIEQKEGTEQELVSEEAWITFQEGNPRKPTRDLAWCQASLTSWSSKLFTRVTTWTHTTCTCNVCCRHQRPRRRSSLCRFLPLSHKTVSMSGSKWIIYYNTKMLTAACCDGAPKGAAKRSRLCATLGFPGDSVVKNLPAMQETGVQSLGQ